jgi:Tol biopolymer transport system component
MLAGSRGFRTARWSPDGKYIAALRSADQSLMLFDFATQHWREIYGPDLGDALNWSRDSQYVYGYRATSGTPYIFRVNVAVGTMEQVASLKGLEPPGMEASHWFGLAPDGSPIISRETGENELISVSYHMP